jgi:hypothetical protein
VIPVVIPPSRIFEAIIIRIVGSPENGKELRFWESRKPCWRIINFNILTPSNLTS